VLTWITGYLDLPADRYPAGIAFWEKVTGTARSAARGVDGEFRTLVPPGGDACLRVQRIIDGPGGCHLDLHVTDIDATAERATALGATVRTAAGGWLVLDSPGGMVFCLVPDGGEARRPQPRTWPGGHRSLADQVCLDIPPSAFDRETGFWSRLTGWADHPTSRPEFRALTRPATAPIRLLLQRLDEEPSSGRTTAHLDLASDDAEAEATRHERLGATRHYRSPHWITLLDPTGLRYCVTRRDPDTGRLR
jgi:predicted enzyme related to lactoylglutathione lyase